MRRVLFFATIVAFSVVACAAEDPLRVGVLSDIHVSVPDCVAHDAHARMCLENLAPFERALRQFRARGVDAVVIAGDLTEFGLVPELKAVADIWYRVFPDDRGADGSKVEKLFILGNHDAVAWRWVSTYTGEEWEGEKRRQKWNDSIARDPAAAWRACFGEDYAPIQLKTVRNVRFVLAHWLSLPENERNWRGGADVPGLAAFFDAHRAELSDGQPFFYVQHAHPQGTCLPFATGDHGTATKVLASFPNAIALSGHAHQPLTDERNVWQGAFTSIGTGTLESAGGRDYRENGAPYARGVSKLAPMPYLETRDCKHGAYLVLSDGRLTVERLDFVWGHRIGPDWTLSLPADGTVRYGADATAFPVPQFAADARGAVRGTDDRLVVTFPAANAAGRVYDYEVRAILLADDYERPVASKRILAPDYHLPPEKANRGGEAWFAKAELPSNGRLRFDIIPVNCFGHSGRVLSVSTCY